MIESRTLSSGFNHRPLDGGMLQYAHEQTDVDTAILQLRERLPQDFLAPLMDILKVDKSLDLAIGIIITYILLYPASISKADAADYEAKHIKEFVPDRFIQDIPLYDHSEKLLIAAIDLAWPANRAINAQDLVKLTLADVSKVMFSSDAERANAAKVLLEYSTERFQDLQLYIVQESISEPALQTTAQFLFKLQTQELLSIYYNQLLASEVLRSFYSKHTLDSYTNNYKLLTLPLQDDPFLNELDKFINTQTAKFTNREDFYEIPFEQESIQLNECLQQKIILQAFFDKIILTDTLIPYGLIIGAHNVSIHNRIITKPINSILIPTRRQLPFEPKNEYYIPADADIDLQNESVLKMFRYILYCLTSGF